MKKIRQEARLSICLLGPFHVTLDGEPARGFESDKARALLVYLVVEADRPHRRETLAGLLWPESPERSARTNLRSALANLRRVIGDRGTTPLYLKVTRQTIQFDTASDAWIDVTAFSKLLKAGLSSQPTDQRMDQSAIQHLEDAVALYRGSFLEGFSIPDCPAFEEWALLKREQLGRQALEALHRLAEGCEAQGDLKRALRHARRAVDLDPWREEAQRQLMRQLTSNGQRAAALAQYEVCRRTLAEELGVEPEAETTTLYRQIKAGEFLVSRPRPAALPNNLPTPLTPFVGRERERAEIKGRLADPSCRLLTVVGPGGVGKTRAVIQAAEELIRAPQGRDLFFHGVFFVPLVALGAGDALVPAIAGALGFSFYSETQSNPSRFEDALPEDQLLDYLRKKNMLLVLDNFEHLLASPGSASHSASKGDAHKAREATGLVTQILQAALGVKILVTSREALNMRAEWQFPLGGMAFPTFTGVQADAVPENLVDYSAVALFAECARRTCPGFSLRREKDAVVLICQLVEGMPLAIELAVAWLKALSPARIAAEIEHGLDILTTSARDIEPRHRSMRAVFDHSWRLLSEEERGVLQRLSVFRGGFRLRAAEAVAGASLPILAGLVEKALLRMGSPDRYQMHELFRQYGLERLQADPLTETDARDRHSAYYARFLNESGEALKGSGQQSALAELDAEIDNARAAWDWAAGQGHVERLGAPLEGMCLYYERRLRPREGEAACRLAAEKLAAMPQDGDLKVLAGVLTWQAAFCPPERAAVASQLLDKSLCLLERPELADEDVRKEKAFVLRQMGNRAFSIDLRKARSLYERSLALYRALGDNWWAARNLERLGWLTAYLGSYEEAIECHEQGLALRELLGDQRGIAESHRGLSIVALDGRIEEGIQSVRECIAIWRQLGDRGGIAGALNQLAPGLILTGRFAEAFDVLDESLALCSDLGLRWGEAWANLWSGFAELHAGKYDRAQSRGEKVLPFSREVGDYEYVGRSLWLLGNVALAREAYAEAAGLLKESVASYGTYGLPNELVWALADLAVAVRGLGQPDRALEHLCEALRTAVAVRAVLSLLWIVPKAALFLADVGKNEQAVEVYALASRYPGVAKSRWFDQVVGRHVAAAADTLPPDVVAAAQARGRARDLRATVDELVQQIESKHFSAQ